MHVAAKRPVFPHLFVIVHNRSVITRRSLLLAQLPAAELPDIRSVPADLETPAMTAGTPAPGRRVRHQLKEFEGTGLYHALYLPPDWTPGRRYPLTVEYAGNGNYRNQYGDVSLGVPEGSNLGYGLSGGEGMIWVCLPYVNSRERKVQITWWGDVPATLDYCRRAVRMLCGRFGADRRRILLCGFSRGAIACNYLGLHDDRIAGLWRAFFCYSHYDGVRQWPFPGGDDRRAALERLRRLRGRPQFICHERSAEETRRYLEASGIKGDFSIHDLPFRNHNDAWVLRNIPLRRALREWVRRVLT